jgi:hypothetical protein
MTTVLTLYTLDVVQALKGPRVIYQDIEKTILHTIVITISTCLIAKIRSFNADHFLAAEFLFKYNMTCIKFQNRFIIQLSLTDRV